MPEYVLAKNEAILRNNVSCYDIDNIILELPSGHVLRVEKESALWYKVYSFNYGNGYILKTHTAKAWLNQNMSDQAEGVIAHLYGLVGFNDWWDTVDSNIQDQIVAELQTIIDAA